MGSFKHIIEKFKDTMIKLLGSDDFFHDGSIPKQKK